MSVDKGAELIKIFREAWEEKYESPLTVNIYKMKWAGKDVCDSIGYKRAIELVYYYFTTNNDGHPLQWFLYNFDELDEALKAKVKDDEERKQIRLQTKERVMNG